MRLLNPTSTSTSPLSPPLSPSARPEDRCRAHRSDDGLAALAAQAGGLRSEAFAEDLGDEGLAQSAAPRALCRAVATRIASCCSSVMSALPGRVPTTV